MFDVAKQLLVVTIEGGRESSRESATLEETRLQARVKRITELGVDILICGAISVPLKAMLVSAGVHVLPHTCGAVDEIVRAFESGCLTDESGGLTNEKYIMPGCCGRRRRFRGQHCQGRAEPNTPRGAE